MVLWRSWKLFDFTLVSVKVLLSLLGSVNVDIIILDYWIITREDVVQH